MSDSSGGVLRVEPVALATPELVVAMAKLIPQLSSSAPPLTVQELEEMLRAPAITIFVATIKPSIEPAIVGTLTLVVFRIPTGVRAIIEDVVVDGSARGAGVGEALTMAAIERAKGAGARTVDLTSRPSREAANRLYQRLGFELRQTNNYRYAIG